MEAQRFWILLRKEFPKQFEKIRFGTKRKRKRFGIQSAQKFSIRCCGWRGNKSSKLFGKRAIDAQRDFVCDTIQS